MAADDPAKTIEQPPDDRVVRRDGGDESVETTLLSRIEERGDELKLVKVNIDEEQGLALRYGVQSIPTIVLFKDGQPAAAAIGAQPKGALERALGLVEVSA